MKMEPSPFIRCAALSLIAVLSVLWTQSAAVAEGFLCNASQASDRQLAVLDTACPIGKGMWGKKAPKSKQSKFWIQCGILDTPMTLDVAKKLYKQITTDVWMKRDGKGYRCLIGPYKSFKQVNADLSNIKKIPRYRDSFIREVASKQARKSKARTVASPTNYARKSSELQAKPKLNSADQTRDDSPEIRAQTLIDGVVYRVPFLGEKSQQYYMEGDKPWSRLSYSTANQVCHRLGMKLPTVSEWDRLLGSKVMSDGSWPVYIPYWGDNKKGLFANGKTNQLKGDSLLNVVCVKQETRALAFRSP
ncbi:SPOR domain-containing protein [Vibrio marisflavi]|nr:SPOR domain-containing protein [Vibrio marisflavi]